MKPILFAFALGLTLAACQSSSKPKLPANVPAEENAASRTDSTGTK